MALIPKELTGQLQKMGATYRFTHKSKASPPVKCVLVDNETGRPYLSCGRGNNEEEALRAAIKAAVPGDKPKGMSDLIAENEKLKDEVRKLRLPKSPAKEPEPVDDSGDDAEDAEDDAEPPAPPGEPQWHTELTDSDLKQILGSNGIKHRSNATRASLVSLIESNGLN